MARQGMYIRDTRKKKLKELVQEAMMTGSQRLPSPHSSAEVELAWPVWSFLEDSRGEIFVNFPGAVDKLQLWW